MIPRLFLVITIYCQASSSQKKINHSTYHAASWLGREPKYSKVPIIRTGTYASSAVHTMYCRTGPSYGTYNRNFRVHAVGSNSLETTYILFELL